MRQGSSIKQWNTRQGTVAQGDRDMGLGDLRGGKKSGDCGGEGGARV